MTGLGPRGRPCVVRVCHLTRPVVDLLIDAGFVITELDVFYEKGAPKAFAADSLGVAVAP